MNRITYLVETEEGWRVDYLMKKKFFVGSGMISSLKRVDEGITLNGRPVHTDVRLKKGDEVSFLIGDVGGCNPAPSVDIPLSLSDMAYSFPFGAGAKKAFKDLDFKTLLKKPN